MTTEEPDDMTELLEMVGFGGTAAYVAHPKQAAGRAKRRAVNHLKDFSITALPWAAVGAFALVISAREFGADRGNSRPERAPRTGLQTLLAYPRAVLQAYRRGQELRPRLGLPTLRAHSRAVLDVVRRASDRGSVLLARFHLTK
jgi:hypothetical protein